MSRAGDLAAAVLEGTVGRAALGARLAGHNGLLRAFARPGLARELPRLLRARHERLSLPVRLHAAAAPDALAVVDGPLRLSYGALDRRVDRLAAALHARLGLRAGDALLVAMQNRVELLEAQLAAARLGVAVVSASWRATPDELRFPIGHAGVVAALVDEHAVGALAALDDAVLAPERRVVVGDPAPRGARALEELLEGAPDRPPPGAAPEEPRLLVYTSGTTGRPKAAVRRFAPGSAEAFLRLLSVLPLRHGDRHHAVAPLYHSTAFGFAHLTFLVGGAVVLERGFDAARVLARWAEERITTTALVPTMLRRLLDAPSPPPGALSHLRAVITGGAPLPPELCTAFLDRFGPVLHQFYGATETGINTVATPDDLRAAPGTIGRPVPGHRLRVLDEAGRPVPDGAVGVLHVKNAMLVEGYHRDADATAAARREGWFCVGDLARRDARTGLWFHAGRRDDAVVTGGVNVHPAEVEAVLRSHPAVRDAGVVGLPDDDLGERLAAAVVLDHPDALPDVRAHVEARLSGARRPRAWHVVDALPYNPTGKLVRRALRDTLAGATPLDAARAARKVPGAMPRKPENPKEEQLDEAIEESFPASDPPSITPPDREDRPPAPRRPPPSGPPKR